MNTRKIRGGSMKKNVINTYLYISWNPEGNSDSDRNYFNSYMAVVRAMIHEEVSISLENIGDGGAVFSSYLPFDEVKEKMKHRKFPYLLIDVSLNIQTDTIDGYLTKTQIEKLKVFIHSANENKLTSLQSKLDEAIKNDDYEKAIVYRDLLKEKKK